MSTWYVIPSDNDLMHHGVKGMKWGVRNDPVYNGHRRVSKRDIALKNAGYSDEQIARLKKNTKVATMLGGPLAGVIAGSVTNKNIKKENANKKTETKIETKDNKNSNLEVQGDVKKETVDKVTKSLKNNKTINEIVKNEVSGMGGDASKINLTKPDHVRIIKDQHGTTGVASYYNVADHLVSVEFDADTGKILYVNFDG